MPDSVENRSALPWFLIASAAAGCLLCIGCGAGGAGAYFLAHHAAPTPAAPAPVATADSPVPTAEPPPNPSAESPVETFSSASPTPGTDSDPDAWRTMGDPEAPVTVEEFGDYQCPFCSRVYSHVEPDLREEYNAAGKVRFIYRNLIVVDTFVADGYESRAAALGSLCAGEQGRFWEYHDLLFENQSGENEGVFSPGNLLTFALDLGLNGDSFAQCLEEERYEDILRADTRRARQYGLNGVPALLVNGELLDDVDKATLFDAIDEALSD
jgi:protein-disulfide isomerase